jgi:hypothetical protein
MPTVNRSSTASDVPAVTIIIAIMANSDIVKT